MNVYETIVAHFKSKKKDNALSNDDLQIIKILFDSIRKSSLDMKHLNNVSASASSLLKIIYAIISMDLKDPSSKVIKTIMPPTLKEAFVHTKNLYYFVYNNNDYKAFLEFTPNDEELHCRDLRLEDVICYFKKRAIHNKILKVTDEEEKSVKKEMTNTSKKRAPYIRIVSVPFGGQNKKY